MLTPKGKVDTRSIRLLEVIWKLVEEVINTTIKAGVEFHYTLHGFGEVRGIATAILEIKFAQELAIMEQAPLFVVLLDLRKAHNMLDRGSLLQTLED